MAQNYSLPKPTEPLLDQFGKVSVPWYNYLRTRFGDGAAEEIIASIEAQIADLIARVEALEEGESAIISGPESVRVVGTLAGGLVQLTLEGDDRSPPPTYYYGTNALEEKGFHPVADTIIQSDGITLTVNADGTTDIAHADTSSVTDISANFTGGTVPGEISFTFDQFGHVLTRTITGRTLDHNDTGALQGGNSTERYHFTAAEHTGLLPWASEDPADYALITQAITNGDTTHAPSGDAVFDALEGKDDAGSAASALAAANAYTDIVVPQSVLYADAINGRLGVGTTSPSYQLHVEGAGAGIYLNRTGGPESFALWAMDGVSKGQIRARSAGGLKVTDALGGTEWVRFDGDLSVRGGRLYGTALHNNAAGLAGATNQYVGSGTYTPTLTNVANIDSSSPSTFQYIRVGNVVMASGVVTVDPTSTGTPTTLGVSLPIASNLTSFLQCTGVAASQTSGVPGVISGDATNDRANLTFTTATFVGGANWFLTFTYLVL